MAVCLFVLAGAPGAWAASEHLQEARHVPASVQRQLPTGELSLRSLCRGFYVTPRERRVLRRQADALVRELRRRPDELVTYTFYYEHGPPERRDIPVRELAEEQLEDLDPSDPDCGGIALRLQKGLG